jgi:hypothetical protein
LSENRAVTVAACHTEGACVQMVRRIFGFKMEKCNRNVLRRIFGFKRENVIEKLRKLSNKEICNFTS